MAEDQADAMIMLDVLLLVGGVFRLLSVQVYVLKVITLSLAVLLEREEVAVEDCGHKQQQTHEELIEAVP